VSTNHRISTAHRPNVRCELSISLIHHNNIRNLDNSLFLTLQLVAAGRGHQEHDHIHGIVNHNLRLAQTDAFDEDNVVSASLTEQNNVVRMLRHTAQRLIASRR
jgi:hypothetical protein